MNRDFHAANPNELWVTDITEFSIPAGKVYLSPVIDCHDGMPVAWTIGTSPNAALANGMLRDACATLKPGETPIIHSDLAGFVVKPGNGSGSWWLAVSHVVSRLNVPGYLRVCSCRSRCSLSHVSLEGSGPGLAASTALRIMSRVANA